MIEVFNAKRTRSFGCYADFKAATNMLDGLVRKYVVSGVVPRVSVSAYRGGVLQRQYTAVYVQGKWRVPKLPTRQRATLPPVRIRHRRGLRREYPSADMIFREAYPDWLNRACPLFADNLHRCNRRGCVYH